MSQQPEEESLRVAMIASAVVDELVKRYGVTPQQVVDSVLWLQEHKNFVSKMKHSSYLTLIGTLIGASLLVAWEGIKAYLRKVMG